MMTMGAARARHRAVFRATGVSSSFRDWARRALKSSPRSELSSKLARVVHGQE